MRPQSCPACGGKIVKHCRALRCRWWRCYGSAKWGQRACGTYGSDDSEAVYIATVHGEAPQ